MASTISLSRPHYQGSEHYVRQACVKGTRISVERVIQHLSKSPNLDDLFAAFPHLIVEDVKVCLAYALARSGVADWQPDASEQALKITKSREEFQVVAFKGLFNLLASD